MPKGRPLDFKTVATLLCLAWFCPNTTFAECTEEVRVGDGDWKEDVLAADKVEQLLVMELTQLLMNIGECEELSEQAGAGGPSYNESTDQFAVLKEADGVLPSVEERGQEQPQLPEVSGQNGNAASNHIPLSRYPDHADNGLEVVLREAIQTETNQVKRRALIERYRQLFDGKEPPNVN